MRNEERDVYVIPPNFIEGGTLMGGMFKTRNVIEAGILGLLVGLPVLELSFSLTTRIIILCLTALPLVLVALIGIAGNSLSAFILQFFSFLRNRRVLSREPQVESGGKKKALLPSWARKKQAEQEKQEREAVPVSRNSLRFDRKDRKVTQHKIFLPTEEKVKPLNPLAEYVPIEKIENGVIYTKDRRYVKVVEVVPVNFLLRSAQEQRSIIYSFISYLKIAPVKVQFKVLTKRADIDRHVEAVRRELERETDPRCRRAACSSSGSWAPGRPSPGVSSSSLSMRSCRAPAGAMRKRRPSPPSRRRHGQRPTTCGNAATRSFCRRTRMKRPPKFSTTSSAAGRATSSPFPRS